MAKALVDMGYQSGVEVPTGQGGYIDVQGRRGKEIINIELVKTHIPDWLIFKFQEAKKIRDYISEEIVDRLTECGCKHFHISELVENLIQTKYFDRESANRFVDNMVKTGRIEIVEPIVSMDKGHYICDCGEFESTQKECSHIRKYIDHWREFLNRIDNMNDKEFINIELLLCKNKSEKLCEIIRMQIQTLMEGRGKII
jgi:hypothetical protein